MGTHSALFNMGCRQNGREEDAWKLAEAQYGNGSVCSFFISKQKNLDHLGYTSLDGVSDHNKDR